MPGLAMQIQYNITRIEEWCKSHGMPEGTLQLEHLMQATKLLQLKKATAADIEIIYDVCWMLSPSQIQRMCTNYFVADYEVCATAGLTLSNSDSLYSIPFLPRSFGLWLLVSSRTTATITCYCHRRARTLDHMSFLFLEMCPDWRRMFRPTSMCLTFAALRHWFHRIFFNVFSCYIRLVITSSIYSGHLLQSGVQVRRCIRLVGGFVAGHSPQPTQCLC